MEVTQEVHYGKDVWVNPKTEKVRRKECLCLNCSRLERDGKGNCRIAKKLYEIAVTDNVAMTITRCPEWKPD